MRTERPALSGGAGLLRLRLAAAGLAAVVLAGPMSSTAHAAVGTAVWAGGAPNLLWSTPANWQSGVVPSTGDDLEFPPGSFSLNDLPEGTSFRSMMLQGARIEGNPIQVTQQIAGAGVVATPITTGVGTLVVQGAVTFQAPIATHGAPVRIAIDFPNGPSYGPTFQGPISGPSALVIESDAIFNHSSSYAGGTTIQSGATVVVTATGGLGDPTTRVTVQGSLQIQPSADTTVLANPLTLVGTVGTAYASSPGTAALTGAIDAQGGSIGGAGLSEPPSLSVAGNITGSLNVDHAALSGVNSFPGGLTIGGIVDVASSGALGGLESTTTVEGNLRLLGNVNVDTHLVLHPTQTSIDTELQGTCGQTCGTATVRGTVQVDTPPQYVGIPRITAWSGEALTMASRLSGSGSLLIIGAADNPIALPTASLYSGPSLNVQNVRLQDALALGSPQAPVLAQGLSAADGLTVPTPLDLVELDNPAGTTTWTGPITTHGARLSAAAGTLRMTGNVSSKTDPNGAPALIQTSGAGTVEFANASTNNVDGGLSVTQGTTVLNEPPGVFAFTGPIAVFAGYSAPATLRLMHDSQLMPQSPVSLNQGGVLDLNGHQQALTSLTMNGGTVTTGAGTLHVNGDLPLGTSSSVLGNLDLGGVTRTLSGLSPSIVDASVVNGAAGVIVEGVLAFGSHARSLYTGPTEVRSSSRADVEGDLSTSPLLVDAHAHLTGSGVVGPATVNGEIANSRGTGALPMSIRGALTMGGTGGLSAYIPQHRNGCGMCAILLNAGSVDLSAHPTLAVDTGVGARAGERFTIVNNSGNAPVLGTFANLPEGGEIDQPDGTRFTISYAAGDGNDIVLTVIQNTTETSMVYGNGGPATVGQPTVIHAAAAGPIGIPSGTVTFFVPGQQPAAVSLDANGQASVTTVFNSSGSQVSVPIRYSGDAWHPAAWGTLTEIVVRPTPPQSTISIDRTTVNVGSMPLGQRGSLTPVVITNHGPEAVYVQGAEPNLRGTNYYGTSGCNLIAAGARCTVLLGAQPTVVGPVSAELRIAGYSGGGTATNVVTLSVTATGLTSAPRATSTQQYTLTGNDGKTWVPVDPSLLAVVVTTDLYFAGEVTVEANADLWTHTSGVNQDLGVEVNAPGQPAALVGWKESGGFGGTFSPNAASLLAVFAAQPGTMYTFTLVWKANHAMRPGDAISMAAGPAGGPYSPTSVRVNMAESFRVDTATTQFTLAASDGVGWHDKDSSGRALPSIRFSDQIGHGSMYRFEANADLWTGSAGDNQDLGIEVIPDRGPTQVLAWKESGGFAGSFSPNAAFVETTYSPSTYFTVQLVWKANHPLAPGHFIAAGAGPLAGESFSPMTLIAASAERNSARVFDTAQLDLAGSDGTAWHSTAADGHRLPFLSLGDARTCGVTLTGSADMWTRTAGINQDLGIELLGLDGSVRLVAWKESGGFAGTYSPNAAAVSAVIDFGQEAYQYTAQLVWKSNIPMPAGAQISMGAGPLNGSFSPTSLIATPDLRCSNDPYG